jgi:hypothetical protein
MRDGKLKNIENAENNEPKMDMKIISECGGNFAQLRKQLGSSECERNFRPTKL